MQRPRPRAPQVGSRFDLLAAMETAIRRFWPKRNVFVVCVGASSQKQNRQNTYGVLMPIDESAEVPAMVDCGGTRGKASEGLRLRCFMPTCKFHTPPPGEEGQDPENPEDVPADIPQDDQEIPLDMAFEEDDDHGEEKEVLDPSEQAEAAGPSTSKKKKKTYTNVFPFAQPISYHARLLDRLFSKSRVSHLVVLTRTSHPAMYVAARGMGLEVVSLVAGATDHGFKHGEDILTKLFRMQAMAKARKTVVQTGVKRVACATVPFINAILSEEAQMVPMKEITPAATSAWRQGFNSNPTDLETKMIALLQKDLEEYKLYVAKADDGIMSLFSADARREGEMLCKVPALLYDSQCKLETFLSTGGHKVLVDRLAKISGVAVQEVAEAEGPPLQDVFAALVGAGRFVRHFLGVRKGGPNVVLVADPSVGASDGFLRLDVSTRNRAGIAPKSIVVANFGVDWDSTAVTDLSESPAKRFKGLLDQFLTKTPKPEDAQQGSAEGEDGPKRKAEEEEEAEQVRRQRKAEEEAKQAEEEAKRKEQENKKSEEESKKKTEEEKKAKHEEDKKKELKKKAEEEKKRKAEEEKAKRNAQQGAEGEEVISHIHEGCAAAGASFTWRPESGGVLTLRAPESTEGKPWESNKKVPPKTMLWRIPTAKADTNGDRHGRQTAPQPPGV